MAAVHTLRNPHLLALAVLAVVVARQPRAPRVQRRHAHRRHLAVGRHSGAERAPGRAAAQARPRGGVALVAVVRVGARALPPRVASDSGAVGGHEQVGAHAHPALEGQRVEPPVARRHQLRLGIPGIKKIKLEIGH